MKMWDSLSKSKPFVLPNVDILKRAGWAIKSLHGEYCVAWKADLEVVFRWRDNEWHQLTGPLAAKQAA
jgi:hypothetical protein